MGPPEIRIARFPDDTELLQRARAMATGILDKDPGPGKARKSAAPGEGGVEVSPGRAALPRGLIRRHIPGMKLVLGLVLATTVIRSSTCSANLTDPNVDRDDPMLAEVRFVNVGAAAGC
jgi:hypothetical protein